VKGKRKKKVEEEMSSTTTATTWADIQRLAADLQRAQLSSGANRYTILEFIL
jgi:hypothetical protein